MPIWINISVFLSHFVKFWLDHLYFKLIFGRDAKDPWKLIIYGRIANFGEIRFLIGANLLNLEPFGLSFPNGGSTFFLLQAIKVLRKEKASCWGWGRGATCRFLLASPRVCLRQISNYYRHLVWIDSVTLRRNSCNRFLDDFSGNRHVGPDNNSAGKCLIAQIKTVSTIKT